MRSPPPLYSGNSLFNRRVGLRKVDIVPPPEFSGQKCATLSLAHFSDTKPAFPLPLIFCTRCEIFNSEYDYTSVRYQGCYGLAEVFGDFFRIRRKNF